MILPNPVKKSFEARVVASSTPRHRKITSVPELGGFLCIMPWGRASCVMWQVPRRFHSLVHLASEVLALIDWFFYIARVGNRISTSPSSIVARPGIRKVGLRFSVRYPHGLSDALISFLPRREIRSRKTFIDEMHYRHHHSEQFFPIRSVNPGRDWIPSRWTQL